MHEIAALAVLSDPGHPHVLQQVAALEDGEIPCWRILIISFDFHKKIAPNPKIQVLQSYYYTFLDKK